MKTSGAFRIPCQAGTLEAVCGELRAAERQEQTGGRASNSVSYHLWNGNDVSSQALHMHRLPDLVIIGHYGGIQSPFVR